MKNVTHIGPFRIAPHKRSGAITGKWCVDIPKSLLGKRKRMFLSSKKEAEECARTLHQRYKTGQWGIVRQGLTARDHARSLKLKEAIERWGNLQETRIATRHKRKISLETDRMRLKSALAFFGNVPLSSITEEKLAEFQAHRLNVQKRAASTVNSDVIALGKVLRWAHRNELLAKLPMVEHVPEEQNDQPIPTRDEVARIIAELPKRLRLLVRFLAETGCRSGEAFNLTWDCVDEVTGTVQIRPNGEWTPKTRSSRRPVYIKGALLEAIRQLPKTSDYVFPGRKPGKPINNIKKAFATAVRKADIRRNGEAIHITPHTLRKAYATWLAIELKVPLRIVQAILGHTPGSRVTDQYYVQPLEDAMRAITINIDIPEQNVKETSLESGNAVATAAQAPKLRQAVSR